MTIQWFPTFRKELIGVNNKNKTVIHIVPVENTEGWDVWVNSLYCGTYLTREMAKGAAIGLYDITINGSAIDSWEHGKIWGMK